MRSLSYRKRRKPEMSSEYLHGRKVKVGDVTFDNVTMAEAVSRILLMVQKADHPCHVCTGNLDHLAMLQKDEAFREIYATSELVLADGMPLIWLSKMQKSRDKSSVALKERVAGSDLFWELGRASAQTGLRLFFLGGMPGAAEIAAEKLAERFPGAKVCGVYCPPFERFETEAEQARIEAIVRAAAPDVLLVGLGAPKQEKWIVKHKARLGVPVLIGVGGSFEMAAGVVKRAPVWAQKAGMEWAVRLMQDPRRLWHRYIERDLPVFARLVVAALRSSGPSETTPEAPTTTTLGNVPGKRSSDIREFTLSRGVTLPALRDVPRTTRVARSRRDAEHVKGSAEPETASQGAR